MKRLLVLTTLLTAVLAAGCALSEGARKKASYHYQMGLSFLGEQNVTRALFEFTEAEKLTPNDPELLNYLGLAYYYKKKYELAEQKFLRALDAKPAYSEARNNLGVTFLEMGRWDDAIRQFKLVSEDIFYQNQDIARINLGLAYYGKGDHGEALSVLRSAVSSNPRIPQGRLTLGKVYFALGKTELAIAEYKAAVDLYRDYADAHYNLALAYLKQKDSAAASAAFREVVRIAPESGLGRLSREYLDLLK